MAPTRKAWPKTVLALCAALAVLFQFGVAQVAMAAPATGQTIEICTSHGVEKITVDAAPGQPSKAPCSHCEHCVMPVLAVEPAALGLAVEPVRYASATVRHTAFAAPSPYLARGPPRPPGQGPPQILNV